MSLPDPVSVKKIMDEVNEWESADKSSFLEEILTSYVNEFVVECIRADLETRRFITLQTKQ